MQPFRDATKQNMIALCKAIADEQFSIGSKLFMELTGSISGVRTFQSRGWSSTEILELSNQLEMR